MRYDILSEQDVRRRMREVANISEQLRSFDAHGDLYKVQRILEEQRTMEHGPWFADAARRLPEDLRQATERAPRRRSY